MTAPTGPRPRRVLVVVGTRPEAVKLAPVVHAVDAHPHLAASLAVTGQHRAMVDDMLGRFGLRAHHDLAIDAGGPPAGLNDTAARVLAGLPAALAAARPDVVVVQGDTTSALAAALGAFHGGVPVAHVEAGLRTGDLSSPFPEEGNRRAIGALAALHLAPTARAGARLVVEGVPSSAVVVTGNTVVDALAQAVAGRWRGPDHAVVDGLDPARPLVVVTLHRRESWGRPLAGLARAVASVARARPEVQVLVPVHPNPAVRGTVTAALAGLAGVVLCEPLSYPTFAQALARATVVLTDSGGVQEEAPTFGVPVLVVREATERPEAIEAGAAVLVGRRPATVAAALGAALDRGRGRGSPAPNPFGDGRAAPRVADALAWHLGTGQARPDDFDLARHGRWPLLTMCDRKT